MNNSFMTAPHFVFTSESVTEGHPDKICDQVSDAILDALIVDDPDARVAVETATTTGLVMVIGEVTTSTYADIPTIIRNTVRDIGYTHADYGFDHQTCSVITSIHEQSADIALGVDKALEAKTGEMTDAQIEAVGAGDQGMMFGFACRETDTLMPLPISLSHDITRRLAQVRKSGELDFLRPDGKSQVTVEYQYGQPVRVDTVVVSTQHHPDIAHKTLADAIIQHVVKGVVPAELLDSRTRYFINPTGRFVTGGPMGDSGVTGRKIIADTYGGMARHGGGAFSGKDPTKVDRSAAYAARYVAKNVVAAGLADRFEVQIAYAIGVARPVSITFETFGTARVPEATILDLIHAHFDLRPGAIIHDLNLRRPIYKATAAYGHFGRTDIDAPWERTDKADVLRHEAGLAQSVGVAAS